MAANVGLYDPTELMTLGQFTRHSLGDDRLTPARMHRLKVDMIAHALHSCMFFKRNFIRIVTKEGREIAFEPFLGQLMFDVTIETQRRMEVAQRTVGIKARQMGWTTDLLGRGFWRCFTPNSKVDAFVPDDDVAEDLMLKVNLMYNGLPRAWRPMKRIDNKKMLILENPDARTRDRKRGLNSSFNITVANPKRGRTAQMVIFSEYAHIPDAYNLWEAVVSAMSAGPESCLAIDTTPNGYDDQYYPMVCEAVERNPSLEKFWTRKEIPTKEQILAGIMPKPDDPESTVPVFGPWHWHEQYTTKDENPMGQRPRLRPEQRQHLHATIGKLEQYGNDEELWLQKEFGVSDGRLWWRRWKLDNDTVGADAELRLLSFRQEFATTWKGCFVEYAHSAFDMKGLDAIIHMERDTPYKGILARDERGDIFLDRDSARRGPWEEVRLWAPPEPGERYVIGVDVGVAYESEDADFTIAQVIRRRPHEDKQVGIYECKVPPYRAREQIAMLYRMYNNAYLAIETENGYTLCRELYDMGCRNQYMYKRLDVDVPESTKYLGWETNPKTRPDMQNLLCELIAKRDKETGKPAGELVIRDQLTIQQLQSMRRDPTTGTIKGAGKSKDDAVLALMIALCASRDPYFGFRAKERERPDAREINPLITRVLPGARRSGNRNRPTYESL